MRIEIQLTKTYPSLILPKTSKNSDRLIVQLKQYLRIASTFLRKIAFEIFIFLKLSVVWIFANLLTSDRSVSKYR
jgi:hypothetical protein